MCGPIDCSKIKSPIVRCFRFLHDDFGLDLIGFQGWGFAWSHWSDGKTDVEIYFRYGDEPPFVANVYLNSGTIAVDERTLTPPVSIRDYPQASEWFRNEIAGILKKSENGE